MSKNFYEILEEQIRAEIAGEIEREVLGRIKAQAPALESDAVQAAGRLESWLASHLGKSTFAQTAQARRSYGAKSNAKASAKPQAAQQISGAVQAPRRTPGLATAVSIEELCALELLRRHAGQYLDQTFTEQELKSAWRKAAMKTHPDRHSTCDAATRTNMAATFRELANAYETLTQLFVQSAQAA